VDTLYIITYIYYEEKRACVKNWLFQHQIKWMRSLDFTTVHFYWKLCLKVTQFSIDKCEQMSLKIILIKSLNNDIKHFKGNTKINFGKLVTKSNIWNIVKYIYYKTITDP